MKKAIKKDKKFIRDGFDGIAAKYDFFNNFITFGQHRRIKKELAKNTIQKIFTHKEPCQILDICCGTGDITHQLKNFAPKNYEIIGMDFSSEMLKIAKKREKKLQHKIHSIKSYLLGNSLTAITCRNLKFFCTRNLSLKKRSSFLLRCCPKVIKLLKKSYLAAIPSNPSLINFLSFFIAFFIFFYNKI